MMIDEENAFRPMPPARSPGGKWLTPLLVAVLITLGTVLLGDVYFNRLLPEDAWSTTATSPWRENNASLLEFESPARFRTAENALKARLSKGDEDAFIARYLLADLYRWQGRDAQALAQYQALLNQGDAAPGYGPWSVRTAHRYYHDEAHAAMAMIYYESNDYKAALAHVERIAHPGLLENAALIAALDDRLSQPERADFHLELGRLLLGDFRVSQARREIMQAAELGSSPRLRLEAFNLLKTHLPRRVADLPPMARYFALQARARYADDGLEAAAEAWEQVITMAPAFGNAHDELAMLYREMGDPDRAEANTRIAVAFDPDGYHWRLTAGDIALDAGRYEEAVRHYQRARDLILAYPDDHNQEILPNLYNQLGYAHESLNHQGEARQYYQHALAAAANVGMDIGYEEDHEASEGAEADYEYARASLERLKAAPMEQASDRDKALSSASQ